MTIGRLSAVALAVSAVFTLGGREVMAETFLIDLTHPMGTFAPLNGDMTKPDLNSPWLDSIAVPTFGAQAVYSFHFGFATNQGKFQLGQILLSEHHGTHMDAPAHFVNDPNSVEPGNPKQKYLHQITADELIGPVVLVDISSRVQTELDKNGGMPSSDTAVTDFSNASNNVVTADDIDAVADQLDDGAWLVANLGWSRFYYDPNGETTPYFNGWNFPGFNKGAVDRLIEIEDQKGIRISGIVIDNIGIDTGESSIGKEGKWIDSWHSHVRGLQRGWKFVENATNLDQLAFARPGSCDIVVGAPKHVQGGGGPSRVFALCEK